MGQGAHTSKFSKSIYSEQQHHTNDHEVDDKRTRSTGVQGTSRTNKQTSANGTPNRDHLHVSALEISLQTVFANFDFWMRRGDRCWGSALQVGAHLLVGAHDDYACLATQIEKDIQGGSSTLHAW